MGNLKNYEEIYEACLECMQGMVWEFEAYLDIRGIDYSDSGEGEFGVTLPAAEIAKKLFMKQIGDSDEKNHYLCRLLNIGRADTVTFNFHGVKKNGQD